MGTHAQAAQTLKSPAFIGRLELHACLPTAELGRKKPYSDRGVRKILTRYATTAGIEGPISPHRLRHFVFTWLKTQGIDDALIQPYSGHATRQSLEIYSRIALADAQQANEDAIWRYPV